MRSRMRMAGTCFFALLLALTLVGCGSDESSESEGTTTSVGQTTTTESSSEPAESMTPVDIYWVDSEAYASGVEPYVVPIEREVDASDPIAGAINALFDGPNAEEEAAGLSFVSSEATGATVVSVESGVARIQLVGGCDSGGSTLTVAAELLPTLQQFDEVQTVKILDPSGMTIDDSSGRDSTPVCLEP